MFCYIPVGTYQVNLSMLLVYQEEGAERRGEADLDASCRVQITMPRNLPDGEERVRIFREFAIDSLFGKDGQTVEAEASRQRAIYSAMLVLVASSADGPFGVRELSAVGLLGRFRSAESVPILLDRIRVNATEDASVGAPPRDSIVIRALSEIGKPASKAAIERLGHEDDAVRAKSFVRVIILVEGPALGKLAVRLAAEKETDAKRKARLLKAVELFTDAGGVVE
jgi:hypothetical protein